MVTAARQEDTAILNAMTQIADEEDPRYERWLVTRAKAGHHDAFGELYKRHHRRACRVASRILHNEQDAEDAAQRAFHRALMNLKRFREDSTFTTWLTRITINEALMMLRQRRTKDVHIEDSSNVERGYGAMEIASACLTPEEIVCQTERRSTLLKAIGKLSDNLKVVVHHRELQQRTTAETAKILGLSLSAVKARAFHARRFLRKHVDGNLSTKGLMAFTRKSSGNS
jgi:RNA polymerase sigma-70 factor, ECF subfamily